MFYIFIYIFLCKKFLHVKTFFSENNVYFGKNKYFFKKNIFFFNLVLQQMSHHNFLHKISKSSANFTLPKLTWTYESPRMAASISWPLLILRWPMHSWCVVPNTRKIKIREPNLKSLSRFSENMRKSSYKIENSGNLWKLLSPPPLRGGN